MHKFEKAVTRLKKLDEHSAFKMKICVTQAIVKWTEKNKELFQFKNQTTLSTKILLVHGLIFNAQNLGQLKKE